jgi:hypothetical protein
MFGFVLTKRFTLTAGFFPKTVGAFANKSFIAAIRI